MMKQIFNPYVLVSRELMELDIKKCEECLIADILGSHQNEKIDEVLEWINEAGKIIDEARTELLSDITPDMNTIFIWCNNMLSRIRKVRAKSGSNFTIQRVRDVGSTEPLSLREDFNCEITLLINKFYAFQILNYHKEDKFMEELQEWMEKVRKFIVEIKLQLEEKIPERNSDWYRNKIAEARTLIVKCEPPSFPLQSQNVEFPLQSQDVGPASSMNMPMMTLLLLHEELPLEIRLLIRMQSVDLLAKVFYGLHDQFDDTRLRPQINESFTQIKLQLQEKMYEKNSYWSWKIAETRTLIAEYYPVYPFLSLDVGSKALVDDMGCTKEQYQIPCLQNLQLEKGLSNSTKEQHFKPSLYLQVNCEFTELTWKLREECAIAGVLGSFQNDEVEEWVKEVNEFTEKAEPEMSDKSLEMNSFWCNNMISRIRKLRAKRGPSFTSSINMAPLSLSEELRCEIISLLNMSMAEKWPAVPVRISRNSVDEFLEEIQQKLKGKTPEIEMSSDWYRNKLAETRTLIAKMYPAFPFLREDVGSSSIAMPTMELLPLHEELLYEIRLLTSVKRALSMTARRISEDHDLPDQFSKELQERINEVKKFLLVINLQLEAKIPKTDSDWYRNKIAETRALIVKNYPAFPWISQDHVESSSINMPTLESITKEQYQIFLSFRGEDTRYRFTGFLYHALHQEGFKIFMDDGGLQRGDPIGQVIMGAIENSKLSIIVFSENFADSTWCLDEVVKILECKQKNNQLVWPIFYKVEPSDVRHQRNNYEKAMLKQEKRFGKYSEMVRNWRTALQQVCGFNAFHYKENSGYGYEFIQGMLKDVINIKDRL